MAAAGRVFPLAILAVTAVDQLVRGRLAFEEILRRRIALVSHVHGGEWGAALAARDGSGHAPGIHADGKGHAERK